MWTYVTDVNAETITTGVTTAAPTTTTATPTTSKAAPITTGVTTPAGVARLFPEEVRIFLLMGQCYKDFRTISVFHQSNTPVVKNYSALRI
jgi:hypothetical protein